MKTFSQYLSEASLQDFDDILEKFETFLRTCDPKHFPHLKGVYGEELRGTYNFKLCRKVIENSELTNKTKNPKWIGEPHHCYYNSLLYTKQYPEVDLCWGYLVSIHDMKALLNIIETDGDGLDSTSISIVEHAFCIEDNTIIDPTWQKHAYYCYQKIPKNVVESFGKDDDKFINYIKEQRKQLENKM